MNNLCYPTNRLEAERTAMQALCGLANDAVSVLGTILHSDTARDSLKVQCASIILDRIIGKPVESTEIEGLGLSPSNISDYLLQKRAMEKKNKKAYCNAIK